MQVASSVASRCLAWTFAEYPQRGVAPSGVPTSHARTVPAASAVAARRGTGRMLHLARHYIAGLGISMTLAGLEPAIFASEGRRLIH